MRKFINIYKPVSYTEFKEKATLEYIYDAKESTYCSFDFDDEKIKFCISTHHSYHRKKLITIISKKRDKETATKIAHNLYTERMKFRLAKSYNPKK